MPDTDYQGPERREGHNCPSPGCADSVAHLAAANAVKNTFAILGVNIDNPKEVEDFRKSLRFGDEIRKNVEKGKTAVVVAFVLFAAGCAWVGFLEKIGRR